MRRDPNSLLWDAREAAAVIATIAAGKTFDDFDRDIVLRSAVERQFEIIGEAFAQSRQRLAIFKRRRRIVANSVCRSGFQLGIAARRSSSSQ